MRNTPLKPFTFFTVQQYRDAKCHLVNGGPGTLPFELLHDAAKGKVCDGCAHFDNGRCAAYLQLELSTDSAGKPLRNVAMKEAFAVGYGQESVKDEAARRGLSINEVRRRRNGTGDSK